MKKLFDVFIECLKHIKNVFDCILYYLHKPECTKLNIYSDIETIDLIINRKISVCRFGDGEFNTILRKSTNYGGKDNHIELSNKLKNILLSNNENVLVCLPTGFKSISNLKYESKKFWLYYIKHEWKNIKDFFDYNKLYGNSNISRPYIIYNNKERKMAKLKFEKLKCIWNNRDILIVEGENTKLGVGNDLFNNANSVERIIGPSSNAFSCYDKILKEIKKYCDSKLVLIALGPTATLLAYDLGINNIQAIDIGHIDLEYEWFLKKAKDRTIIEGKAVNEISGHYENCNVSFFENDDNYKSSIRSIVK